MDQGPSTVGDILERAFSHFKNGDPDAAGVLCDQALDLVPGHPGALHLRGAILARQGRHDEAVPYFSKATLAQPDNFEIFANLAMSLMETGDAGKAVAASAQSIRLKPDAANSHITHGNALHRLGRTEEAAAAFSLAAQFAPSSVEAHYNLGNALRDQRRFNDAAAAYRRAIEIRPDLAQAHQNLASVLHAAHGPEAGLAAYKKAIELTPSSAGAFHNLGIALQQLHRFDDAATAFRRALPMAPDSFESFFGLTQVAPLADDDPALEGMERQLAESDLPREHRAALSLALATALGGQGRHAEAFEYAMAGNRARREDFSFGIDEIETLFARFHDAFGADLFWQRADWGNPSELPVFILGLPCTGKRAVADIIAGRNNSHRNEIHFLRRLGERIHGRLAEGAEFPESVVEYDRDAVRADTDMLLTVLARHTAPAVGAPDVMADTVLFLGLAGFTVPRARIIHCTRDAQDTGLACYFSRFPRGAHPYAYDLAELGAYCGLYGRMMEHWKTALPNPFLEVRFDEMAAQP